MLGGMAKKSGRQLWKPAFVLNCWELSGNNGIKERRGKGGGGELRQMAINKDLLLEDSVEKRLVLILNVNWSVF